MFRHSLSIITLVLAGKLSLYILFWQIVSKKLFCCTFIAPCTVFYTCTYVTECVCCPTVDCCIVLFQILFYNDLIISCKHFFYSIQYSYYSKIPKVLVFSSNILQYSISVMHKNIHIQTESLNIYQFSISRFHAIKRLHKESINIRFATADRYKGL